MILTTVRRDAKAAPHSAAGHRHLHVLCARESEEVGLGVSVSPQSERGGPSPSSAGGGRDSLRFACGRANRGEGKFRSVQEPPRAGCVFFLLFGRARGGLQCPLILVLERKKPAGSSNWPRSGRRLCGSATKKKRENLTEKQAVNGETRKSQ